MRFPSSILLLNLGLATALLASCSKKSAGETTSETNGQPTERASAASDAASLDQREALLEEVPEAKQRLADEISRVISIFPDQVFEVAVSELQVARPTNDRFVITIRVSGTVTKDLYSIASTPVSFWDEKIGQTIHVNVVEPLYKKGETKSVTLSAPVRHGPMNWGRTPDKVIWNWDASKRTGDDMEIFEPAPFQPWTSAENLKITSDEQRSEKPDVLVRGTPDYHEALNKWPKFAEAEAKRSAKLKREVEELQRSEKRDEIRREEESKKRNLINKALK